MRVRGWWAVSGFLCATTGCATVLGDFALGSEDATAGDAQTDAPTDGRAVDGAPEASPADATSGGDSGGDATLRDGALDGGGGEGGGPLRDAGDAAPVGDAADAADTRGPDGASDADGAGGGDAVAADGACGPGLTACMSGCVALDASPQCGACGHDCHRGACTAGACGAYVVAQQPTTGTVAKLATDGLRVIWADTGIVAIEQIPATGGTAIALAPTSSANGAVGSELALGGSTVAFTYLGTTVPSVGLAAVDVPDSGRSAISGALAVNALSMNLAATHVFYVDITGTRGSLNDCVISGLDAGACTGVASGRFLGQTAADNGYLFFDLTGADTQQAGLYLDPLTTNTADIFDTEVAQSVAVDGTWAYWAVANDGGTSFAIHRTLESAPGSVLQTVATDLASTAFATDGVHVYYGTGSSIVSKPVGGGPETPLAPASGLLGVATGGGLLVWTDGTTIWGLVLP
jgi:hypothetical protein